MLLLQRVIMTFVVWDITSWEISVHSGGHSQMIAPLMGPMSILSVSTVSRS